MGLRCKPGDLCLVIGSQFNDGKYVTVVEFIGGPIEIMHSGGKYARLCDKDVWVVDQLMDFRTPAGATAKVPYMRDAHLIPIQPKDGFKEEEEDLIIEVEGV
jgi:hypothetical protein